MLQKDAITEIPLDTLGFCSNVFLQSIWRVVSSKRLKTTARPHRRTSLSHAHYKLSAEYRRRGDYAFKIDLQDAYFHVLIHPDSRKYLRFAFENKVYQFRVLPFCLNTAPQVFTCLGHTVAAYIHHQGISVIPYLYDWLINHPDCQALPCHVQSPLLETLDLVGLKLNEAKSKLDPVQDIQFLGLQLRLDQGRASLSISKAQEIIAGACRISFQTVCHTEKCPSSWDYSIGPPVSSHWVNYT